MKFFGFFWSLGFIILSGCEDWAFKDSDLGPPVVKETAGKGNPAGKTDPEASQDSVIKAQEKTRTVRPPFQYTDSSGTAPSAETSETDTAASFDSAAAGQLSQDQSAKTEIPKEETTVISGKLKLTKDLVIQDRRVVLNMAEIKTFEHDLFILAEEFVSIHSVIQNFSANKRAKRKTDGKSGGNILIEAKIAKGELQLVLNGQRGGKVPGRRQLSEEERHRLKGSQGLNGYNAVYQTFCRDINLKVPILVPFPLNSLSIPLDRECWEECAAFPTPGDNGGKGLSGLPGWDGKDGGDSGSFHLKASQLSEFRLADIQNNPGLGSKGGKGSKGGYGGSRGWNGDDEKDLCDDALPRPKKGRRGEEGPKGQDGKNGEKGTICLERVFREKEVPAFREESKENTEERTICH